MKCFGKWLVMTVTNEGNTGLACNGFKTKTEAVNTLNNLFSKIDSNLWEDTKNGCKYWIEKNTTEYR